MSGEAWSCFAQLPSGLLDPKSASLTLNWLKPKPTQAWFKLTRDEVDADKYARNLKIQRQAVYAGVFLAVGIAAAVAADRMFEFHLFASEAAVFAAVWAATTCVLIALFIYGLCAFAVMRYRRAEPRRIAFNTACIEFEQIDGWRRARCSASFWSDKLDEAAFEIEAAELLAGYLRTGQVMLTRAINDYGVDALFCSPQGRVVAQCKQWRGRKIGAAQVRELAGSKAFFGAELAFMVSLEKPSDDHEQCAAIAASQRLELWDAARIVAVAQQLRNGNGA